MMDDQQDLTGPRPQPPHPTDHSDDTHRHRQTDKQIDREREIDDVVCSLLIIGR